MNMHIIFAILAISLVPFAYAAPNDYFTPEPVASIDADVPVIAQTWEEITVIVNICDARFNPDCKYGTHRAPMQAEYTVSIHHISQDTGDLTLIDSVDALTNIRGFGAIAVLLDGDYEENEQYQISIQSDESVFTGTFWTFVKNY